MSAIKVPKIKPGDLIAVISPSWGGPDLFSGVYEKGIEYLKNMGFKIKEYPSAKADAKYLNDNPKFRAKDLNDAFADPKIKAIIATIGGDDCVRLLPYLDKKIAVKTPKFIMGYSDTAILTTFYNHAGIVTFNGPSIMAGFSQADALGSRYQSHLEDFLLGNKDLAGYIYQPYDFYANGYPDWGKKENLGKIKKPVPADGWRWLQGEGIAVGELFGGCIEVLEFTKGTLFWPPGNFWQKKIFFLETSEEKPKIRSIKHILRNYGLQGAFNKISALIFGRARDYSDEEKNLLDETILDVVANEFGNKKLTIVTNMDFGHTDPQIILPLGVRARLDNTKKEFSLLESPFQA